MKNIHLWWTIGVLIVVILLLIAYIYVDLVLCSHVIGKYLSVVATVLSIILSIFAIVSTVEASRQWADIDGAVKEIKTTNSHIHSSNQMLLTLINNIYGVVSAIGARQQTQASAQQTMNNIPNTQNIPGNQLDNQNNINTTNQ